MNNSADTSEQSPEAITAQLLHDAPCGFLVVDQNDRVQYVNSTLARWLNRDTNWLVANACIGDVLSFDSHLYYETQLKPMLALQGYVREISCKLSVNDRCEPLPVLMNAILRQSDDGAHRRIDFAFFDITERVQFDSQLRKARAEAEELAAIVRNATVGILRCDAQGNIKTMNKAAAAMLGANSAEMPTRCIDRILVLDAEKSDWFKNALESIGRSGSDHRFEAGRDGAHFNISVAQIANPEEPFSAIDYSVIVRDVTQRVLSERRLNLLVGELNHRNKNLIAVIIGMVRQALHDLPKERKILIDRLMNLSASHDILITNRWENAPIMELVKIAKKQVGDDQKIRFSGEDVLLAPNQFKALSMALHELITNARKYGALTADSGSIHVDWKLNGPQNDKFELVWRESGGPPVEMPEKRGFGTVMLERLLAAEFDGSAQIVYRPEGIEFTCRGTIKSS